MSTTSKGEEALQRVILRAVQKDVQASRPVMEGGRYDLVLDIEGRLWKVQVKYAGQSHGGAIKILTASTDCRGKKGKLYEDHEVDLVFAYSPVTNKVYRLPPGLWRGKRFLHLRYEPAKNNQQLGCINAADFEW